MKSNLQQEKDKEDKKKCQTKQRKPKSPQIYTNEFLSHWPTFPGCGACPGVGQHAEWHSTGKADFPFVTG